MKSTNTKISVTVIAVGTFLAFLLYAITRNTAVIARGNSAFGGEILFFDLPFTAYMGYRTFCDYRNATRK